jgi:hypothetical protein
MPFQISKRSANLGADLKATPTTVKDQILTRQAIPVANVQINDAEFGALVLNDGAPKHFWKGKRDPALSYPHLGVQSLNSTMRHCKVDLWLQDRILTLTDCTITKSRIILSPARVATWGFTIWALPNLDELILALMQTLGQPILIAVDCPTWGAQQDLPLDPDDEEETEEDEPKTGELLPRESEAGSPEHLAEIAEEQGKSSIQRQIEASEAKKAKAKKARKKKAAKA